MLLLGPANVKAICLEIVLAFPAAIVPFICGQIFASRILAEPEMKWIWHEIHLSEPIPPCDVQRSILEVHAWQSPHGQGGRLWLLVGNFVICSFRGAVRQTSPLIATWQLPISGSAALKLWFARQVRQLPSSETQVWQLPNSGLAVAKLGSDNCRTRASVKKGFLC